MQNKTYDTDNGNLKSEEFPPELYEGDIEQELQEILRKREEYWRGVMNHEERVKVSRC